MDKESKICVVSKEQFLLLHNFYKSRKDYIMGGLPNPEKIIKGDRLENLKKLFYYRLRDTVNSFVNNLGFDSEMDETVAIVEVLNNYLPYDESVEDAFTQSIDSVIDHLENTNLFTEYIARMSLRFRNMPQSVVDSDFEVDKGLQDAYNEICEKLDGDEDSINSPSLTEYLELLVSDD